MGNQDEDLRKIRMLLETMAKASKMLYYVTQYVTGRNAGFDNESGHQEGGYIRFFSPGLGKTIGAMYEENFKAFPNTPLWQEWLGEVRHEITAKRINKQPITQREDAEDRNALKDLPSPLQVLFYQFESADPMEKKRFGGIYNVFPPKVKGETGDQRPETGNFPLTPLTSPLFDPAATPIFSNRDDCLEWAVKMKVSDSTHDALMIYESVKRDLLLTHEKLTQELVFTAWIAHVRGLDKLFQRQGELA